jgi:hypothetical protein
MLSDQGSVDVQMAVFDLSKRVTMKSRNVLLENFDW